MSADDPTLPGTPRTRRSSTDVDLTDVREGLAVRRGMSVQSLRALDQIEPVLRAYAHAASSEERIEALRGFVRVVRSTGRQLEAQLEAQIEGLNSALVTAQQTIELLTPYRAMYERASERAQALASEVASLRDQLRDVRGGR